MKSIAQKSPFGDTIFCDDIRYEVGGKVSYIGTYRGSLIIYDPFPVTLPKFGFAIRYSERPGESEEDVTLGIYMPGDDDDAPSIKIELPIDELRSTPRDPKQMESEEDLILTAVFHMVTGINIKEEGRIKVRAYRGDLEVRLGTLFVRYIDPKKKQKAERSKGATKPKKKPRAKKKA